MVNPADASKLKGLPLVSQHAKADMVLLATWGMAVATAIPRCYYHNRECCRPASGAATTDRTLEWS